MKKAARRRRRQRKKLETHRAVNFHAALVEIERVVVRTPPPLDKQDKDSELSIERGRQGRIKYPACVAMLAVVTPGLEQSGPGGQDSHTTASANQARTRKVN
jgi:hypothetical protein